MCLVLCKNLCSQNQVGFYSYFQSRLFRTKKKLQISSKQGIFKFFVVFYNGRTLRSLFLNRLFSHKRKSLVLLKEYKRFCYYFCFILIPTVLYKRERYINDAAKGRTNDQQDIQITNFIVITSH